MFVLPENSCWRVAECAVRPDRLDQGLPIRPNHYAQTEDGFLIAMHPPKCENHALLRRTKITLLQNEIVQNTPGSAIREGGPRRLVSHAWRAATQQLLKRADKPVLRDKQIFSPRKVSDGGTTPPRI